VPDFLGGEFENFQCFLARVPGQITVFWVNQEVAVALADGTYIEENRVRETAKVIG
jgi:hypothetical protein